MRALLLAITLSGVLLASGCGGSTGRSEEHAGLVRNVRAALVARLQAKHLDYRWVVCLRNGRSFRGRQIVRCNVNFGDPHIEAYCAVVVRGRLRTSHEDSDIPCAADRAGWNVSIESSQRPLQLEETFVVAAPPERTWALLNDIPRVVPCMPGATLTEVVGDDAWKATIVVRLGPITLNFGVDVGREEVEAGRRVRLRARARELRGRGGADAVLESSLSGTDEGTLVSVVTELALRGPVAQYGRSVLADVAAQLTKEFAACIASRLAEDAAGDEALCPSSAPARPAIGGGRLVTGAVVRALARLLRLRRD